MKQSALGQFVLLAVAGLSLAVGTAQADYGTLRFSCQVTTETDKQGYVAVRADSKEEALAMAGRAKDAITRLETREAVKAVVQCVPNPGGRFTDAGFQTWVDEVLPR